MPQANCPTCHNWFDVEKSTAMPFCSERCQLVDLGRWIDERYAVPVQRQDEFDDEEY
ncbi:MAG: DNA gyrase inhibitor YacG [Pirellulaceae bacterium]